MPDRIYQTQQQGKTKLRCSAKTYDDTLRRNDSLKLHRIMMLFLMIHVSYHWASIAIPDDTPKSTISKENDNFNIFQDHLYSQITKI